MDRAKAEVLRYLGHRGQLLSKDLELLVEHCMEQCRAAAKPKWTWRLFSVEAGGMEIRLAGTNLALPGADIARHLEGCEQAAVLAATLGVEADTLIRGAERTDLTRSVILDACATQLIEESCDLAEAEIRTRAAGLGLEINYRYSPGYGDLPLEVQPGVLGVVDAGRRIGLTCTESLILLPRKSVTALVGLFRPGTQTGEPRKSCDTCSLREICKFRKDGKAGGCEKMAGE